MQKIVAREKRQTIENITSRVYENKKRRKKHTFLFIKYFYVFALFYY